MSMTTPAGWYPDPSVPGTERWWDGTAWTAHTRAVQAQAPAAGFGPPTVPMAQTGGPGGKPKGRLVAFAVAGVVLVAAVATAAVLLAPGDDDSGKDAAPSATAPVSTSADPQDTPSPTASADDADVLSDQLNGISIPIPEGWEKSDSTLDEGATMRTELTYECPAGGSSLCRHGRISSIASGGTSATTPKALAEQDIVTAADKAYDEDVLGSRIYGGITSHTVLKSQSFAVAGRAGHLVRWRVVTGKGPGGYVQSLVFPSTVGTEAMVIVRFAFDAGPDAPKLADMDRIAASIRADGDTGSGGVGSSIGPSN
ncbi:DUF2510 domain-containing protein [Streptomyces sp. AM8-1-1]|uniref:DUF2510 domain-containing protein n=1 Tax=Streptomyces sp. AM8-1-1 TaxID=3075825 RepID=UPI0028C3FA09|nr:DUF2510 domain-containing protein [Streptomyces sp. AM8-1-1]WNO75595.1 DUF2510 domain-containing protein [Streptomyces sp. AM8-1-1]